MNVSDFRELLRLWISNSWLSNLDFTCDDSLIERAFLIFRKDYQRWYAGDIDIQKLIETPQLIAVLLYRISREIYLNSSSTKCYGGANSYSLLARHIGQIEIFYSADIGESFKINHGVGTVIGARCKIGRNCMIHQNCTIGDRNGGRPTIGDNVVIYAGSMILGDIVIGDNCIIGANSVVTKSFPANSVLVGSPARNINQK